MSGTAQLFPVVGSSLTIPNPLPTNVTEWDSTILTGAPTNFGTAPSGTVIGGNVSLFAGGSALVVDGSGRLLVDIGAGSVSIAGSVIATVSQGTSPWVVAGNKTNNNAAPGATNEGVLPAVANAATQTWTEGNQVAESVDLSGRQRMRGTLTNNNAAPAADQLSVMPAIANAAAPTWTEGDQVLESVDLAGNQRVVLKAETTKVIGTVNQGTSPWVTNDSADMAGTVPGTAPASTLIVGEIYNSSAPAPTAGQTLPLQADASGNTFVRTSRRSLTAAQATTISSSTATTTILAAQAAGVFADITDLIITVTPQSVTGVTGTATLSDGTNSYIFDIVDATITGTVSALILNFTTPLAATTAATPWTIALSNGTMTVHITVNAVLQKAS